ncbi:HEAT repeat domain-containing protein [Catellatospora coxensis]|uniref:NACHT domain-containing protein n=1 Tax=Catellatospora coxensis TaxID=310354 RepID=A0A8J3P514_9ACTN|nr:HEAT repeat domain-containing protein [Catellatospora coxensis]GIG03902.1 hypothetical protein Cco03nite_06020 [Catellatospora coxensis]
MRLKARSTWWYAAAALVIVGVSILMFRLVMFLVGQTLGDADSWMSVAGGLTAMVGVAVGAIGWLLRRGREAHDDEAGSAGRLAGWEAARQTYGTAIRRRYQSIDLEVLTPLSEQDEHPPLRIGEIFVGQLVKTDPPAVELPRELMLRLAQDDLQELRDLPPDVDQNLLAEVRKAYTQRPPVPVLELLAGEGVRLVLLGDPGAGKSTLARYVVYTLSGQVQPTDPLAPLVGWLPLIVELRSFSRVLNADPVDAFGRYWQQRHAEGTGLPPDELMDHLRDDGRAVVFFDGLDEVFEPGLRDLVERHIVGFADAHPRARVVVTSRPVGYQGDDLRAAGFAKAKLQDLDQRQIRDFVTRWYQVTCRDEPTQGEQLSARLLRAIGDSNAVAEIAGNPMLLTILAIIGRRRALPRDRSSVFEHAVTVMVEHWDPSKFLNRELPSANLPYLDATDKLELLRLVARRMQDSPAGLSGNFISGHDLTTEFADFLRERDPGHVPLDKAKQAAVSMIQQFRDRNFILSRFGGNVYGFVHRSFLEYLAAADIVDRFHRTRELTEDQLVERVYVRRWKDPAWQEVLLLVTGMLGEATAERCILALLAQDPHWGTDLDAEPKHLVLAVRCVAEVRKPGRLTMAGPAILKGVIHALEVARLAESRWVFVSDLASVLYRAVVPVLAGFGSALPGRDGYLSWYEQNRADLGSVAAVAAELANAVQPAGCSTDNLVELATGHLPADVRQAAIAQLAYRARTDDTRTLLCQLVLAEGEPVVRRAAVSALGTTWRGDSGVSRMLRELAANDHEVGVREAAVHAMARCTPADPAGSVLLRELAQSADHSELRKAAVSALGIGWPADAAVSPLLQELAWHDPDVGVRQAAIHALGQGRPVAAETIATLHDAALNDPERKVRLAAMSVVSWTNREAAETLALLRDRALADSDPFIRQMALREVAQHWRAVPETFEFVADRGCHDVDELVRAAVVSSLRQHWHGHDAALRLLYRWAAEDGNTLVRRAAVEAIAVSWRGDANTLPYMREILSSDPDPWVRAAALEAVAADPQAGPDTLALLHQMVADTSAFNMSALRRAAVDAIVARWRDDEGTLPLLHRLASQDEDWSLRQLAASIIVAGWPDEPGSLPLAHLARQSPFQIVSEATRQSAPKPRTRIEDYFA